MISHFIIKITIKFLVVAGEFFAFLYVSGRNIYAFFIVKRINAYSVGIVRVIGKPSIIKAQNVFASFRIEIGVFQKLFSSWFRQILNLVFANYKIETRHKFPDRSFFWDKLICKKSNAVNFAWSDFRFY